MAARVWVVTIVAMKTFAFAAAAAAALILCATLVNLGATAGAQSTPTTLNLTQLDHDFKYVDVPPKGGDSKPPSAGDELVIGGKIAQGGSTSIVCTVVHPGRHATGQCTGVLVLTTGQISFTSAGSLGTNTTTSAITGGTGAYAGAKGTVVSKSSDSGGKTALTVTLL